MSQNVWFVFSDHDGNRFGRFTAEFLPLTVVLSLGVFGFLSSPPRLTPTQPNLIRWPSALVPLIVLLWFELESMAKKDELIFNESRLASLRQITYVFVAAGSWELMGIGGKPGWSLQVWDTISTKKRTNGHTFLAKRLLRLLASITVDLTVFSVSMSFF